jgi:hypothetical protein
MSSQTVYFTDPADIVNLQNSVNTATPNYEGLPKASIKNPGSGSTGAFVPPFVSYYNIGQDLKNLMTLVWNDTNKEFFQTCSSGGIQNWPRADWMGNKFMSGAVQLGLTTKYPNWTFRATIGRTNGSCLFDSLAASAAGKYLRISTLGDFAGNDLATLRLATGTSANLISGFAPYSLTSVAINTLADTNVGMGVFTTTGTNAGSVTLGGSILLDGVRNSIFTGNLNNEKEFFQAYTTGLGYGLRTDSIGGANKFLYFVANPIPLESPSTPNTGSVWLLRIGYQQS